MDPSSADNNDKLVAIESWKSTARPKLAQLRGTKMTVSGEEDSLVTESTQNLLEFAVAKGHTLHSVTHMTNTQLADFLRDFYGKIKLKSSDSLTLKDLRAGLHKFFLDEVNIDILHDRCFDLANDAFDLALRAHRKCHRMRIETDDLKKIYLSKAMDTEKPDSLQNKVFFDISLYICNKGKEYFRNMKKNDFDVSTDSQGRRYVWLKDSTGRKEEMSLKIKKSVDEDPPANQVGERMYERPGDPRCPLASFQKYVTHLHPMIEAFWQRPKRNVSQSDYVWFEHTPLGNSTLTKIMQRISLQAGLSDNYTNYSIRSACIPLLESVCYEALQGEKVGTTPQPVLSSSVDIVKPAGTVMTHSASEELSSDDGMSQTSEMQGTHSDPETRGLISSREKTPGLSSSVGSGSIDTDDADYMSLMQAKTKVLDLIRGLMVKDIQKFVDWLKTVRVQYSGGELIVLCSPVDRSSVEPIPDDFPLDRNILHSHGDKNGLNAPGNNRDHLFKKSASLEQTEKQVLLKKNFSLKEDSYGDGNDVVELADRTTVRQVEFSSMAGFHCSSEEFGPMKVSIPTHDTLLVTGVPGHLQVMLHKKKGPAGQQEPLPERVFYSENDFDVAEIMAIMSAGSHRDKQHNISNSSIIINGGPNNYHTSVESQNKHHLTVQQHHAGPVMVTIPAAHTSSFAAKEHFRYHKNKSLGCLDQPPPLPEGITLKRVYSTGTPVLKRQANVMDTSMYPENLTVRRDHEELQATNLSMKPLKQVESSEAKRARAERLTDSLRVHQEILQNSPLIKRPGERNFSGFRHCYANTVSSTVKSEPLDTSYS
ncbi:unnamed protein product [Candidula unifasciata]|uniref:ZMYM2-like/QRICH1 C-terminal domain-containing protein n=1 Tax=Candidula unifasciata TaxID=100452 RepID=A0A8S3ZH68_9EUPU|nr:unnamed protein product [Candidula unifasciata]